MLEALDACAEDLVDQVDGSLVKAAEGSNDERLELEVAFLLDLGSMHVHAYAHTCMYIWPAPAAA